MRHELAISGSAFRLRPAAVSDAPLIVELRTDPARTRHLHQISPEVSAQEDYLREYMQRADDYYFVVERLGDEGAGEGLIGIYDVDTGAGTAEWGRWVIHPRSLAATESAWLIYRIGFEELELNEVYCRTIVDNASVLSFHDRCGLIRRRTIAGLREIDGSSHDVVEHVLTRERWPEVAPELQSRAERLALRLNGRL